MRCLTLSAIPPQHLRCAVGVGLLAVEVEGLSQCNPISLVFMVQLISIRYLGFLRG